MNSTILKMDDVQIKLSELDKEILNITNCKCVKESMQNQRNCITLEKAIEDNYANVNQSKGDKKNNSFDIYKIRCNEICKDCNVQYLNETQNIHKLTTINEHNENHKDSPTDLCYHGCKNGCSATVPTPQEVSDKVFKENWLQKLEDIKQKETILRNREAILQIREKALFKKEREIKIFECLWKYKLKQLDLHLKENKNLQYLRKNCSTQKDTAESTNTSDSNEVPKEESCLNDNCIEELNSINVSKWNLCTHNILTQCVHHNQVEQSEKHTDNIRTVCKNVYEEKIDTLNPSYSSGNNASAAETVKNQSSLRNSVTSKSIYSKVINSRNSKRKKPSKIDYNDLDTTLSADIGDSSFVQTSQKFNPEEYRKPYMFIRLASERHIKHVNNKSSPNVEAKNLDNPNEESEMFIGLEQDKILKRVTKNIIASRDKSTKFQDYGYMDQNINTINKTGRIENEKKYSYLDLETGNRLCSCQKFNKDFKRRPVSWNEDTNEWLQKKREAYNMMIKKTHTENKENLECNTKLSNKSEKVVKKKDIKKRILTIFH